jgi:hypothetical protein
MAAPGFDRLPIAMASIAGRHYFQVVSLAWPRRPLMALVRG